MSNLKDQVLSIKQVQELQELGFDVSKYSSMEYAPIYNNELKIDDYYLRVKGTGGSTLVIYPNKEQDIYIPTLTIGDIIKVLPVMIGVYSIDFYFIGNQVYVDYIYKGESLPKLEHIWHQNNRDSVISNLIIALFNILKWCIKEKHI